MRDLDKDNEENNFDKSYRLDDGNPPVVYPLEAADAALSDAHLKILSNYAAHNLQVGDELPESNIQPSRI